MFKTLSASLLLLSLAILITNACLADSDLPEELDKLVNQCSGCHGTDGNSKNSAFPSIAGINENYFKYAMEAYKIGNRKSDMMKNFADSLSAEDMNKLAEYYVKQTFKSCEQPFDESLAEKGKAIHDKYCIKCHNNNGRVDPNNYGILAGQWMPYLQQTIKEYLDGTRKVNPIMLTKLKRVQKEVGEEGLQQLIHFYASVK